MVQRFTSKPKIFEAVQYTGTLASAKEVIDFVRSKGCEAGIIDAKVFSENGSVVSIRQPDAETQYTLKDWWCVFDGTWFTGMDPHRFESLDLTETDEA